jgi:hypothetical protein
MGGLSVGLIYQLTLDTLLKEPLGRISSTDERNMYGDRTNYGEDTLKKDHKLTVWAFYALVDAEKLILMRYK